MVKKSVGFLERKVSNRFAYTIISAFAMIALAVVVYAVPGTTPNPGHPLTQLQPCSNGETLVTTNGAWNCTTPSSGGSSQWTASGSDIYYTAGNVGIRTNSPTHPLVVNGTPWPTGKGLLLSGNDVAIWGKTTGGTDSRLIFLGADDSAYINAPVGKSIRFRIGEYNRVEINSLGVLTADTQLKYNPGQYENSGGISSAFPGGTNPQSTYWNTHCNVDNVQRIRARSGVCTNTFSASNGGKKMTSVDICLQVSETLFAWVPLINYNTETSFWQGSNPGFYSWSADCNVPQPPAPTQPQCPSGQTYYYCAGVIANPGCYSSEPSGCYNTGTGGSATKACEGETCGPAQT